MEKAKQYYEKMIDFKQYARVMLAVSAFFYLGVVIPSIEKNQTALIILMVATSFLLVGSILSLFRSKTYYKKLLDIEEGQEFLLKK